MKMEKLRILKTELIAAGADHMRKKQYPMWALRHYIRLSDPEVMEEFMSNGTIFIEWMIKNKPELVKEFKYWYDNSVRAKK